MMGAHCGEVVEALALTAALSIDPNATLTLGPASRDSRVRAGAASADGGDGQEAVLAPSPGREGIRVTLGASMTVQTIMTSAVHLGAGAMLSLARQDQRTWFPLEARMSLHALTQAAGVADRGILTRFILSRLVYCPVRLGGDLSLLLCPAAQAGAVLAESRGFEDEKRATRWFVAVGLEAWLRARISQHWELWLSPSLAIPLTERRFAVQPGPEVVTATVGATWGVSSGVGWVF